MNESWFFNLPCKTETKLLGDESVELFDIYVGRLKERELVSRNPKAFWVVLDLNEETTQEHVLCLDGMGMKVTNIDQAHGGSVGGLIDAKLVHKLGQQSFVKRIYLQDTTDEEQFGYFDWKRDSEDFLKSLLGR